MIDERTLEQMSNFDFILGEVMADRCPSCGEGLSVEQIDVEADEWSHFCPDCGFDFVHRRVNWKN